MFATPGVGSVGARQAGRVLEQRTAVAGDGPRGAGRALLPARAGYAAHY